MDFSSFWPFSSPSKQAAAVNADGAATSDSRHGINAASINGGPGAALVSSVGRPLSAVRPAPFGAAAAPTLLLTRGSAGLNRDRTNSL